MNERVYSVAADVARAVQRRVAEAIAWCSSRAALDNLLRTPGLRPDQPFVIEQRRPDGTYYHEYLDTGTRAVEVERVGLRRVELMALNGIKAATVPPNAARGRLLVAEIDNSVWDGLSEAESNGFFDVCDIPPWDTWIHLRRVAETDALLCWVPSPLIEAASNGIAVNCTDCIAWVDKVLYSAR